MNLSFRFISSKEVPSSFLTILRFAACSLHLKFTLGSAESKRLLNVSRLSTRFVKQAAGQLRCNCQRSRAASFMHGMPICDPHSRNAQSQFPIPQSNSIGTPVILVSRDIARYELASLPSVALHCCGRHDQIRKQIDQFRNEPIDTG
jgi:hypothetical protein